MDNIMKYSNLVKSICSKYSKYYEFEDLYQVGMIGLIKAVDNYKENNNSKFSTYAYCWIKGEILDYIRKSNHIKISKEYLSLNKKIEDVKCILRNKLNREPTLEEISIYLDIDIKELSDVINSCLSVDSLDYINDNDLSLYDSISCYDYGFNSDIIDLKEALELLDENDRKIIEYRYFYDLSQSDTGRKLGINQVKVSRQENKILSKLKLMVS